MDYANYWASAVATADLGDTISQSLRFSGSKLTGSTVSTSTWTCSFWIKFAVGDGSGYIFSAGNDAGVTTNGNQLYMNNDADSVRGRLSFDNGIEMANRELRDPNAWYHIVGNYNGSVLNYWVNNESLDTLSGVAGTGHSGTFVIGGTPNTGDASCWDAINLAEFHYIDGTVLTPSSFGRYQEDGIWVPKNYTGTHGTDGFHLNFADSSDLGNDVSGNNNDFTASGFDTAAISSSNEDNDVDYNDTPTNNYATLNPLLGRSASLNFEHANLRVQYGAGGSHAGMVGFGMPGSSGKYYWEVTLKVQKEGGLGIVSEDFDLEAGNTSFGTDTANGGQGWEWILTEGRRDNNNVETSSSHTIPNVGDTIGFLLDTDAGTCTIEINGVAQTANNGAQYTNIPTDKTIYPYFRLGGASGDANLDWNFGQMNFQHEPTGYQHVATNSLTEPTIKNGSDHFQAITAGPDQGVGSGERGGNWSNDYYIYQGSQSVLDNGPSTTNLASPTKGMLAGAAATDGFDGDNSTYAYSSLGFAWVWRPETPLTNVTKIELRNATGETVWINGSASATTGNDTRQTFYNGSAITLETVSGLVGSTYNASTASGFGELLINDEILVDSGPLAAAQAKFSDGLYWIKDRDNTASHQLVDTVRGTGNALKSDSLDAEASYAAPTGECVAWCWKAGGTAVSNGNGTITSSVSANTDAGFSIISYTGNGTGGATIGHGLTQVPEFVIVKRRAISNSQWYVYHGSIGNQSGLNLNSTVAQLANSSGYWNNTSPTNQVISLGNFHDLNKLDDTLIAYAWHSVEGYSKFGTYTGNGSSDDNAFVYLGFTPALLIIKRVDSTSNWHLRDTTRATSNPDEVWIEADNSGAEGSTNAAYRIDHLSNGFKWRGSVLGASGGTYIYMAWARNPFGGENAPPATAR